MSQISDNLEKIKATLPGKVTLVAVSKTKPVGDIIEAYKAGQKVFGENRVQEIIEKYPELPDDVRLHMIGHLQTNKVKYIIDKVSLIEGVDSLKLIRVINREALKHNRVADILLQFHIADEETKYGFSLDEIVNIFEAGDISTLENIRIRGVMGMATFTDDREKIRHEFRKLSSCFYELKKRYFNDNDLFSEISMGMSGDYEIAIEEGSTMIRIGSAIFGVRNCAI